MSSSTFNATLWILDSIKIDEINLSLIICELPNITILKKLDDMGVFKDAIANQVLQIINTLKGNFQNNTFIDCMRTDKLPLISSDEDFMLLQFQKGYLHTTSNMVIRYKHVHKDINFLGNNLITNEYFKNGTFKIKCGIKIILDNDSIYFALNTLDDKFNTNDINNVKIKIM